MKLRFIQKHLANDGNRAMLNLNKYKNDWLPYLKRKGIYNEIKLLCESNKLNFWLNEILFFAGYYSEQLDYTQMFSDVHKGMPNKKPLGIDGHWFEYYQQKNNLIELVENLNVRLGGSDCLTAPYIESIVIRVSNQKKGLRIDNYTLCYDIAELLMKYLGISIIYDGFTPEGDLGKTQIFKFPNSNKKTTSYIKKFMQETYPLFLFLKKECNLNLPTDREYFSLTAKFLEAIGFDIENKFGQLPEDYIKNCYKQVKI